jgi:hypothetical protein
MTRAAGLALLRRFWLAMPRLDCSPPYTSPAPRLPIERLWVTPPLLPVQCIMPTASTCGHGAAKAEHSGCRNRGTPSAALHADTTKLNSLGSDLQFGRSLLDSTGGPSPDNSPANVDSRSLYNQEDSCG